VARLTELPGGLRIELTRADGTLLSSRELPTNASCDARALSAAIVLATWLSGTPVAPEAPPLPPEPAPRATVSGTGPQLELGLGVRGEVGGGVGVGPVLFVSAGPAIGGLGGSLAISFSGERSLGSSTAPVRWEQFTLSAGPRFRFEGHPVSAELELHAKLGVLSVRSDAEVPSSESLSCGGVLVGGRIRSELGLWAGAGVGWTALCRATSAVASDFLFRLPRVEGLVGVGASWQMN
jgi:hypothetical protein